MTGGRRAHRLVLGRICGVYGVRGWVKVYSETDPIEGILGYSPWTLGDGNTDRGVAEGKRHGKGLIARLEGCDDRDQAAALVGMRISVPRDRLPPPAQDEYYWADLEGLFVSTLDGIGLGQVDHLFSTPGNDVLVVKGERERLIPFIWGQVIKDVDLEQGLIRVDWDPGF
jgi:16S rRNA processing protein RimM